MRLFPSWFFSVKVYFLLLNSCDYWWWLSFLNLHLEKWEVDNSISAPLQFMYLFIHLGTIPALWHPGGRPPLWSNKWISPDSLLKQNWLRIAFRKTKHKCVIFVYHICYGNSYYSRFKYVGIWTSCGIWAKFSFFSSH